MLQLMGLINTILGSIPRSQAHALRLTHLKVLFDLKCDFSCYFVERGASYIKNCYCGSSILLMLPSEPVRDLFLHKVFDQNLLNVIVLTSLLICCFVSSIHHAFIDIVTRICHQKTPSSMSAPLDQQSDLPVHITNYELSACIAWESKWSVTPKERKISPLYTDHRAPGVRSEGRWTANHEELPVCLVITRRDRLMIAKAPCIMFGYNPAKSPVMLSFFFSPRLGQSLDLRYLHYP